MPGHFFVGENVLHYEKHTLFYFFLKLFPKSAVIDIESRVNCIMRCLILGVVALSMSVMIHAQPRYDFNKLKTEKLNRGVVAVRQNDGSVAITWRTLKSDRKGEAFDVFRDGHKLNDQPLTTGGTYFADRQPSSSQKAVYKVVGGGLDGEYTYDPASPAGYLSVKLDRPEGGRTPDARRFTYSANDASVADVDGDGEYEILLKWDPSNAHDNAHDGFTGNTLFDCYKLDGTRLWRIDMGHNIRSGAHYVPFIFYDLDGDGCAEFIVKTGDGTVDGLGNIIGNPDADYREGARDALENFEKNKEVIEKEEAEMEARRREWAQGQNGQRRPGGQGGRRRNPGMSMPRSQGRILTGPEYITVFDGRTGAAMDTKEYIPERGELRAWGDDNANRSERYLAAVGYFDGEHCSAVFCRGYYTRTVIVAWDWDGKALKERWTFDTNNPEWKSYAGQGNHNLRVADVDGDGCDEITYGSMAVDNDGRGLYNTGMGHGDAIHLTAFDPSTDELQVWDCHENRRDGSDFRNARTGEVIFQIKSNTDVGRAMAADVDPTNWGVEMWSSDSHGVRNIKGEVVSMAKDADDPQHDNAISMNGAHLSVNFGIWWDGDLLRELLDRATVSKYDWQNKQVVNLQRFEGCQFNNGTKSNPCLSADLFGDWREEVMVRDNESTELRIYVTPYPTDYRVDCLMQDIPYRLSVATENVGYNQPPETGFYLGPDRTDYLK